MNYEQKKLHEKISDQHKALQKECEEIGIPLDSVNHYWHKGKNFSIHSKNNTFDKDAFLSDLDNVLKNYSPPTPTKPKQRTKGSNLLVINPADIHIGKYSCEIETGEKYDTSIAKARVMEGIQGIVELAKGFEIERIMFAIGNDVLHVDNVYNTTTAGTRQDVIGKWHEHFTIALELYIWAVDYLRKIAPVDAIHSMSNHDYQSGFHLAHCLKTYYRNDKDINVEATPKHRKYYRYGNSLIGLSHGDGAKTMDLPLLMANEAKQHWAVTRHRYWYLHHVHHKVKYKWLDGKDYHGCSVEFMRSPSADDSWHNRKGYTQTPKGVEGFVHHHTHGQVARFNYLF